MAICPIVLGIKPSYPTQSCEYVEIIYRNGNDRIRLDDIHITKAKKEIDRYDRIWLANVWRYMDGLSDWESVAI